MTASLRHFNCLHCLLALPLVLCLADKQHALSCDSEQAGDVSLLQRGARSKPPSAFKSKANAFVSLLYGNISEELVMLRVMMSSAKRHGSNAERLVITPQGALGMPQTWRDILRADGIKVSEVPPIDLPVALQGRSKQHWFGVLNKFNVFNMTQYNRIALLDTDVAFSGKRHPDDLFQACGDADVCTNRDRTKLWEDMAVQGQSDCNTLNKDNLTTIGRREIHCFCRPAGNTGVMVVKPSPKLYKAFVDAVAKETRPFALPDQHVLACFIHDNPGTVSYAEIDATWNACHSPWNKADSAALMHWCGDVGMLMKPFQCRLGEFCGDLHGPAVLQMWVKELGSVDSCTLARHTEACAEQNACHWCGNYCMDKRVGCSEKMFAEKPSLKKYVEMFEVLPPVAQQMVRANVERYLTNGTLPEE